MRKIFYQKFFCVKGLELLWTMSSMVSTASCLAIYIMINGSKHFDAKTIYVSISLISTFRYALIRFPDLIVKVMKARISLENITKFLKSEEIDNSHINSNDINSDSNTSILFDNISFCWDKNSKPVLHELYAEIQSKCLVAIIGEVGSAKSSLLSAIIGELFKLEGDIQVNGSLAYVPQKAWIQNATIKENITFKSNYDKDWYQKVVDSCALTSDFEDFPAGDETEIGQNGVNLSGGQKMRICLSRAVYHNSDIYLLDDPLCSVDARTAKHIFHEVIGPKGLLSDKTRVWVTNNYSFLNYCDSIIILKNGKIDDFGTFDELKDKIDCAVNPLINKKVDSEESLSKDEKTVKTSGVLIKDEEMENEEIKFDDFIYFIKKSGIKIFVVLIIIHLFSSFCHTMSSYWINQWTNIENNFSPLFGLTIYLSLTAFEGCFVIASNIITFYLTNELSFRNFQELLSNTIFLNLQFFDVTPIGRIITRFTRDLSVMDQSIPYNTINLMQNAIRLLTMYFIFIPLSSSLSIVLSFVLFGFYKLHVSLCLIYFSLNRSPYRKNF